jgi:hypothetical protein
MKLNPQMIDCMSERVSTTAGLHNSNGVSSRQTNRNGTSANNLLTDNSNLMSNSNAQILNASMTNEGKDPSFSFRGTLSSASLAAAKHKKNQFSFGRSRADLRNDLIVGLKTNQKERFFKDVSLTSDKTS